MDGLGAAQGTYGRTGAEKGASIFSQRGGEHLLLLDKAKSMWKVVHKEQKEEILASAPMGDSLMDPPRVGWEVPFENRGCVAQAHRA